MNMKVISDLSSSELSWKRYKIVFAAIIITFNEYYMADFPLQVMTHNVSMKIIAKLAATETCFHLANQTETTVSSSQLVHKSMNKYIELCNIIYSMHRAFNIQ